MIQVFHSVLARKAPATLACARLSDSMVGTYLQRAKQKQEAGISYYSLLQFFKPFLLISARLNLFSSASIALY